MKVRRPAKDIFMLLIQKLITVHITKSSLKKFYHL